MHFQMHAFLPATETQRSTSRASLQAGLGDHGGSGVWWSLSKAGLAFTLTLHMSP